MFIHLNLYLMSTLVYFCRQCNKPINKGPVFLPFENFPFFSINSDTLYAKTLNYHRISFAPKSSVSVAPAMACPFTVQSRSHLLNVVFIVHIYQEQPFCNCLYNKRIDKQVHFCFSLNKCIST
jgi:hypothetical protein